MQKNNKMKEKNYLSVVVYIHNDENKIERFFTKIIKLLEDNFEKSEIICVNDSSTDDSAKKLKEIKKDKSVSMSIINMSYKEGLEKSMIAGTNLAIGDFVIEIDDIDVEFEFEKFIDIYKESLKGYDIVVLSPTKINLKSKMFYKLFNKFSKTKNSISTERARVLSRRAINRVGQIVKSMPYRKVAYLNCGLKYKIVKYDNSKKSKTSSSKELAVNSLIIFTNLGYKCSLFMSTLMIISTIFTTVYCLVYYFEGKTVEGWTTTLLFLSFCFFGLFILATIIIKYLSILVENNYYKNYSVIESIDKISVD